MSGDVERFLVVGAGLFVLGVVGFLTRRNLIMMSLSAEMMLHGVSLTLVTFGRMHGTSEGQAFTIFTLTVAACEAGLALALVLNLYRKSHSLDIQLWSRLREPDLQSPADEGSGGTPLTERDPYKGLPKLTPAGRMPSDSEAVRNS
jgi:NADH-quinone oxidoreductase subunit K